MAHAKTSQEPNIPYDKDTAQWVLGSIIIDPTLYEQFATFLRGSDFYPSDRAVWEAAEAIVAEGGTPEEVAIIAWLERHGRLAEAGGRATITPLTTRVPPTYPYAARGWAKKLLQDAESRTQWDLSYAYSRASQHPLDAEARADIVRHRARLDDIQRRIQLTGNENNEFNENSEDESDENSLNSLNSWPQPMRMEAYTGPIGHWVLKIAPSTEAAPEALLVQCLIAVGNAMGRSAHYIAEADSHYTNLYVVVVAGTGARKGSSWGQVRRFLDRATTNWVDEHIIGGLSSGEGLINAVRDDEPAVSDKAVLAYEPEFASVFKVKGRDGNTLSTILRQGWDGSRLASLTRTSPLKATGAHISLIGHITPEELRQQMSATDAHNGFANRILWVCAKRARFLPDGGDTDTININDEVAALSEAITFAKSAGRMRRDEGAKKLWYKMYRRLSTPRAGVLGHVTGRAEAQVLRLSVLYALLDCSPVIREEHLAAALAVWDYCVASAGFIFGAASGNPFADDLCKELTKRAPEGMTRTEISAHYKHNKTKEDIDHALGVLEGHGLVEARREIGVGGRKITRWYATAHENNENNENEQRCPACGGDDIRPYGDELRCSSCDKLIEKGGA